MNILSLNSQVVAGHVGNSAAVLPLQLLGFEVWAIPTVLYSNHPGHGAFTGRVTPADEIEALVDGLDQRGQLNDCDGVLVGYLGNAAQGAAAADSISRVQERNPEALVLCDPVMGDRDSGLYVSKDVCDAVKNALLPRADIVTPNHFELETLAGSPVRSLDEAIIAAKQLRPETVVCTSLQCDGVAGGQVETLLSTAAGSWVVRNEYIDRAPHGTGDMLAALVLGHIVLGRPPEDAVQLAVSAVWSVIAASAASVVEELALVDARANIEAPGLMAGIEKIDEKR